MPAEGASAMFTRSKNLRAAMLKLRVNGLNAAAM